MIYVSSSCSKEEEIGAVILELARDGFCNIELSGGTEYYEGYENDILDLKKKYNLNYLVHNYFPPPKEHFVLNLASLDDVVFEKSFNHLRKAIVLAKKLGASRLSFHAGYLIELKVDELGRTIARSNRGDVAQASKRFCEGFLALKNEAGNLKLYIENNVYSHSNVCKFGISNPFMLTTLSDYHALKKRIDFYLLLDVAHLYVTCQSLGLDFASQFHQMIMKTDYIHLSHNDGYHDQNSGFSFDSNILSILRKQNLENKIIVLEIYTGLSRLKESFDLISALVADS